jgi:uncharacterized membrane protein YqjE
MPAALRDLARTVVLYLEARARLLQIEGEEAGAKLLIVAALGVLTVSLLVTGWLIALPALLILAADAAGWEWWRMALALAAAHLFLGLLALAVLKRRIKRLRLFDASISQLQKDREWLAPEKK